MERIENQLQNDKEMIKLRGKSQPRYSETMEEDKKGSSIFDWLHGFLQLIQYYGFRKIAQALLIIGGCILFATVIDSIKEDNLLSEIVNHNNESHKQGADIRMEISPKINRTLTRMLYALKADRVSVLEMHNGKENPTALPFLYCDMTYEEVREHVPYISDEYENLNMGKFYFPSYIIQHKIFIGSIDEMIQIDKRLGIRLETNDVKYLAVILIRTNVDIGFLVITWRDQVDIPRDEIVADLTYYVQEIGTYLDYTKQQEIKRKERNR
jgi:hypothetical protein